MPCWTFLLVQHAPQTRRAPQPQPSIIPNEIQFYPERNPPSSRTKSTIIPNEIHHHPERNPPSSRTIRPPIHRSVFLNYPPLHRKVTRQGSVILSEVTRGFIASDEVEGPASHPSPNIFTALPHSSPKSIQPGFSRSINQIFFFRVHPFSCLSQAIASSTNGCLSNQTSRLQL